MSHQCFPTDNWHGSTSTSTKPKSFHFTEFLQPQVIFGCIRDKRNPTVNTTEYKYIFRNQRCPTRCYNPQSPCFTVYYWVPDHADLCNPECWCSEEMLAAIWLSNSWFIRLTLSELPIHQNWLTDGMNSKDEEWMFDHSWEELIMSAQKWQYFWCMNRL